MTAEPQSLKNHAYKFFCSKQQTQCSITSRSWAEQCKWEHYYEMDVLFHCCWGLGSILWERSDGGSRCQSRGSWWMSLSRQVLMFVYKKDQWDFCLMSSIPCSWRSLSLIVGAPRGRRRVAGALQIWGHVWVYSGLCVCVHLTSTWVRCWHTCRWPWSPGGVPGFVGCRSRISCFWEAPAFRDHGH